MGEQEQLDSRKMQMRHYPSCTTEQGLLTIRVQHLPSIAQFIFEDPQPAQLLKGVVFQAQTLWRVFRMLEDNLLLSKHMQQTLSHEIPSISWL